MSSGAPQTGRTAGALDEQKATLLALADRCEREESTRELDARIHAVVYPAWVPKMFATWGTDFDRPFSVEIQRGTRPIAAIADDCFVVRYTFSIDAAVMLVPKDTFRETNGPRKYLNIPTPVPNYWHCKVWSWAGPAYGYGWAATEALAICAAALRVRAAASTDEIEEQGAAKRSTPHD